MLGAEKGKDKGYGKGAKGDKGEKGEGGKGGHTLNRTRLSADKFTGTVTAWKGKYGWITPAEEVHHEKASMNRGGLFVSFSDISPLEALETGAPVEFHIFEDESGLGADEVVQTGPGNPKGAGKGSKGGKDAFKGGAKGGKDVWDWGCPPASWKGGKDPWGWGGGKDWFGGYGGKGGAKGWGPPAFAPAWSGFGKGADKGKGKGKSKEGGKGHMLPRTRVSAEKFVGTVAAWKGKYGWLTPAEEVNHEKANMKNGGIFVSVDDLSGTSSLTPGAKVEFHIWEDSSGLGAEDVVQTSQA